jgi:flavorubredoxin/flavin reductase (DIM6/NTAB) family NADH-FMN oxidoreductase RutF
MSLLASQTATDDAPVLMRPRDVQVADIGEQTLVLRSRTWDRLKFEMEYARQKGTTSNAYLIQAYQTALLDPPGESFTDIFLDELYQHHAFHRINYIILSHVNPNRLTTLKRLIDMTPHATIVCSKPAANLLRSLFPNDDVRIDVVRDGQELDLGEGHVLRFYFVPTPRLPDAIFTYDTKTQILFTDKLFGAHICDDAVVDKQWKLLDDDRHYYFECLHAAQAQQVETVLKQLEGLAVKMYAPAHGPMVRYSVSRLTFDYRDWSDQQAIQFFNVVILYTSAYGSTGAIARAIAQGITQSGSEVVLMDCEATDPAAIIAAVETCDGFVIGSPTLGGHAPTQIQTALGIVLSNAAKTKVAGVFGSYGWSGEAVDQLENKLQDAGYQFGLETIRVKFTPTTEVLSRCEAAGAEFVQTLKKTKKVRTPRQVAAESDRTSQAVGRVTNALCVLTAKSADGQNLGMLTSWISQASFTPPGLTIALEKNQPLETLVYSAGGFVLNILKEGRNLRRHFQRTQMAGEDVLTKVETETAANGCLILTEALAYLECTVENRMDCGDHWLLYAVVHQGKVLDVTGATAVNHRKSGSQY